MVSNLGKALRRFLIPWVVASVVSVFVFSGAIFYGENPLILFGIGALVLGLAELIALWGQSVRVLAVIAAAFLASLCFMFGAVAVVVGLDDHEIVMHLFTVPIYGAPFGLLHGAVFAIVAKFSETLGNGN